MKIVIISRKKERELVQAGKEVKGLIFGLSRQRSNLDITVAYSKLNMILRCIGGQELIESTSYGILEYSKKGGKNDEI